MDPIVLLLAAQLLIIIAILLTTSKSKMSSPVLSFKTLLASIVALNADNCEKEECSDFDNQMTEDSQCAESDALVISEKDRNVPSLCDKSSNSAVGKNKRKKKHNLKINEQRLNCETSSVCDMETRVWKINAIPQLVGRSLRSISPLNFIRWVLKIVVKQPFKGFSTISEDLDGGKLNEPSSRVSQPKLIESNYLVKIIAARKCEKIVRIKVARLNMAIMKSRGVRPLQMVPEAIEQEA